MNNWVECVAESESGEGPIEAETSERELIVINFMQMKIAKNGMIANNFWLNYCCGRREMVGSLIRAPLSHSAANRFHFMRLRLSATTHSTCNRMFLMQVENRRRLTEWTGEQERRSHWFRLRFYCMRNLELVRFPVSTQILLDIEMKLPMNKNYFICLVNH